MRKFNLKVVLQLLGVLLVFNGSLMLFAVLVSILTNDGAIFPMALASFLVLVVGGMLMLLTRSEEAPQIQKREGYFIVVFGWIAMTLTGMLPFLFTKTLPSVSAAFFETLSGYTTTGASVIHDLEILPESILFGVA